MAKRGRQLAAHHRLIVDTIDALLSDRLGKRNVMILTPPGSAKSTYTSMELPAWFLNPEKFPHDLILACSYSKDLVNGFGRSARNTVEEEAPTLGVKLSDSASAADDWRVSTGGGYFCAGVGGGVAGHRARLGLIDDYIGSEQAAVSEVQLKGIYDWYWNDFWPRLLPDAYQVIIANRRSELDLVGRLLTDYSDKWHVIKLPMLAEEVDDPLGRQIGERLWPEWFTEEQVELAKRIPSMWAGLYQQRPAPEEGDFFKKDWIVPYRPGDLPRVEDLRMYVGSDYALRTKDINDLTAFVPAGMDNNGRLWILPDWFWKRVDTLEAVDTMLEMVRRRRPITWFAGKENIVGSIEPFLNERMRQQETYVHVDQLPEAKDKMQKAQPIKTRMSAKTVMFPEFAPGYADMVNQLITFPNGAHDDFVDALAKLGQGLDTMVKPSHRSAVDETEHLRAWRPTCGWVTETMRRRERNNRVASREM